MRFGHNKKKSYTHRIGPSLPAVVFGELRSAPQIYHWDKRPGIELYRYTSYAKYAC